MVSWNLIKYVLTAAVRDRLVISLIIMLVLGSCLALFMGSAAVSEKGQFLAVFAAGGLRFVGVLGLVLFVVFFIRRSFDSKDVEYLLSRPVGRIQFLLSYTIAFATLAAGMGLAQGLCLYVLGNFHAPPPGEILWCASIIMENIIMVTAALFFAMVLSSAATAAMATCGLYVLARMMGQILGIIDTEGASFGGKAMISAMEGISAITPRLDLMGQTSWLIYGPDAHVGYGFIAAQGIVFTALVFLAALIDFVRKQF